MSEFKVLKTSPVTIVNVQQFTKHAESGAPLHAENGFFKIFPSKGDGDVRTVEASYSHPFGMNEFEFGTLSGDQLSLQATEEHNFQRPNPQAQKEQDDKAKTVTGIRREYSLVENGKIQY